jgi:hypothetical protein
MSVKATPREFMAYMIANREHFPNVTDEEIANFAAVAERGDILAVIANPKKTTFSSDVPKATKDNPDPQSAAGMFADMLIALAAEVLAGVKPSGTSGFHQIGVPTRYGQFRVVLEPVKEVGKES